MRASAGIGPCALMPRSAGPRHGRLEDVGVLVAEDPVLPGVRVESADADRLVGLAERPGEGPSQGEDVVGPLRGAVLDRLLEGDVGGEVEEVEVTGGQHEAEVLDAELVGEQFGVTGPLVAAGLHGGLVERGGDDAVDEPLTGQPAGFDDEAVGAVACRRAELADRHVGQRRTGLDQLDQGWGRCWLRAGRR